MKLVKEMKLKKLKDEADEIILKKKQADKAEQDLKKK